MKSTLVGQPRNLTIDNIPCAPDESRMKKAAVKKRRSARIAGAPGNGIGGWEERSEIE